ncbi:MAG: hypothetical protein J7474_10415, partial [Arthrobacter sp.]|nr:hypothetical protein [Arthrobacter sp.]
FKKIIRDLKEDPWELMKMFGRKMPDTVKGCMGGGLSLSAGFGAPPSPIELGKLFWDLHVEYGSLQRLQMTSNTQDQIKRFFPRTVPYMKGIGMQIVCAMAYAITPRHTDDYYAAKIAEVLPFKPDAIYLKDQGGLLTVDRARTLLPVMLKACGDVPFELHSHCTTGLAPLVYMEALKLGVRTIHTGVPPLADGPAQPSVLTAAKNARRLGFETGLDEDLIKSISERLTAFAVRDGMPIGRPLAYDSYQYEHQIPGGVISNFEFQLSQLGLAHRLDEAIAEAEAVQRELGYPIMITPYSQYVVTQSMMNVVIGVRYGTVGDEIIRFAAGFYGEDSGYEGMDQNLKDRLLSTPRAKELLERSRIAMEPASLKEVQETLGGPGVSDEELILRVIMQGTAEVAAMRAAGPMKRYDTADPPVIRLMEEINKRAGIRSVNIQRGADSISLRKRAAN